MHICYICREFPPSKRGGGISTYLNEMASGLVARGHKVTIICASDDTQSETTVQKGLLTIIRLSGGDFVIPQIEGNSILKKARIFYRFYSYRRKIKYALSQIPNIDIIELAEYGAEGYYIMDMNIPIITRLHCPLLMDFKTTGIINLNLSTLKYYWQGKKELECIHKSKYLSSPSNVMAQWGSRFGQVPLNKIKVIANPISNKPITSIDTISSTFHNDNITKKKEYNILFVGTICEFKGCGELCEAIQMLNNEGFIISLTMIGKQGTYAKQLKQKYSNANWLNIQNFKPHNEILQLYSAADVVCLPSWWESFSLVCTEAMQEGAIVIGSKSGGMNEIITDGVDGFLVQPHSTYQLCETIKKVLSLSIKERHKIAFAAQTKIMKTYNINVVIDKMINYYKECINDYKEKHSKP